MIKRRRMKNRNCRKNLMTKLRKCLKSPLINKTIKKMTLSAEIPKLRLDFQLLRAKYRDLATRLISCIFSKNWTKKNRLG